MENQAEQLPANYPFDAIEHVTLHDGTPVIIRPIQPDDGPELQSGFLRLSPSSVYLRFLDSVKQLPERQAHELATVDYQKRMAFVAGTEENGQLHGIGVARYALVDPVEAGVAECAVVVLDEYQRRGLGKHLLRCLIQYARKHGVCTFVATVHVSNRPILRLIQGYGVPYSRKMIEPGVWEVHIHLPVDLSE